MTGRLHSRRDALGLIGATALAGPALAQSGGCAFAYWSSCDIDDILWSGGKVIWRACRWCDDGSRREMLLRTAPGGPVEEIAPVENIRYYPFDDRLLAIDGPRGARRTLTFSLPDLDLQSVVEDNAASYKAEPAILRETRAVMRERLPNLFRAHVNFRYGVAIPWSDTGHFQIWWMATGQPEALQQVAEMAWPKGFGNIDIKFQTYDGSTVISPFYRGNWYDVREQVDGMPIAVVQPDGNAKIERLPDGDHLAKETTIIKTSRGFVVAASDVQDQHEGLYHLEEDRWVQIYRGGLNQFSLPFEPGGTRLAWSSRDKLPPEQQKRNGLWTWRHQLLVTEI